MQRYVQLKPKSWPSHDQTLAAPVFRHDYYNDLATTQALAWNFCTVVSPLTRLLMMVMMVMKMTGLTGGGRGVALGVPHQQLVLQTAPAHTLRTNQNQRLPLEGRDFSHFFVDPQLMAVKF